MYPVRVPLRESRAAVISLDSDVDRYPRYRQGFPPFSGSTPDETWVNLKNWPKVLRRPVYDKPEDLIFNLTDQAWEAVVQ